MLCRVSSQGSCGLQFNLKLSALHSLKSSYSFRHNWWCIIIWAAIKVMMVTLKIIQKMTRSNTYLQWGVLTWSNFTLHIAVCQFKDLKTLIQNWPGAGTYTMGVNSIQLQSSLLLHWQCTDSTSYSHTHKPALHWIAQKWTDLNCSALIQSSAHVLVLWCTRLWRSNTVFSLSAVFSSV